MSTRVICCGAFLPELDLATSGFTVTDVSGDAKSSAWSVYASGYELGYDQITAPVTVSSTTEASGTSVIACTAHTFDGTAVIAHFFSPKVTCGASGTVTISLFEDTTQIGRIAVLTTSGASAPCSAYLRFTPSAGSHTYTVTAINSTANGTIGADVGGTGKELAAFIRFSKA